MSPTATAASGSRAPLREASPPQPAPQGSADTLLLQASDSSDAEEPHAFGIEKGFWKIHNAAQELLKFAAIYQARRDTAAGGPSGSGSGSGRLPKEIDMLSMTQLSWSVLHAVGDINNHNQRLAGRHDASWVRRHLEPGASPVPEKSGVRKGGCEKRARKRRRGVASVIDHHRLAGNGCIECGAAESPCWRLGPAGPLTLCNVCGLLYAKRAETVTIGPSSDM
ncbi:hypothetical protein B0T25DRAFT_571067 [Lasiosphaeria hispida]|uniref:GATA-type domain-containing protein n=1 Tax=Lasiosphaeria hispida TaxID=260671 RepID=A0AAJ0HAT0_9PEZI|nr:hypothetical protein B0T25DRAFT_571067 [Lasiosphaeria hispida]